MKRFALKILSLIYGAITSVRNFAFDTQILKSYKSRLRVVSVGNLTAGGNGKTMVVMELCRQAVACGYRPVVLSRGYGGQEAGPLLVTPTHQASIVGDEPLLMCLYAAGNWSVVVARSRVSGAKFIEENDVGDLIILDDGFQHRWLARDVDLVAVNISGETAIDEFVAGDLLPLGYFREDRTRALNRATHLLWVSRSPLDNAKEIGSAERVLPQALKIGRATFAVRSVEDVHGQALPANSRVNLFCALGNPQGFIATVLSLGYTIDQSVVLNDHEAISAEQLQKISSLPVVCSEKDFVKLPKNIGVEVYRVKVGISIDPSILSDVFGSGCDI